MSTDSSVSSNPFVRLDRIIVQNPGGGATRPRPPVTMATTKCFICANPAENKNPSKTQKEQAVLLKTFVKSATPEIGEGENGKGDAEEAATTTTCPACEVAMTTVWNLHGQMVAVLKQIDDVVKLVRDTMPMLQKKVEKKEEEKEKASTRSEAPSVPFLAMEQFTKVKVGKGAAATTAASPAAPTRDIDAIPILTNFTKLIASNGPRYEINGQKSVNISEPGWIQGVDDDPTIQPIHKYKWSMRPQHVFSGRINTASTSRPGILDSNSKATQTIDDLNVSGKPAPPKRSNSQNDEPTTSLSVVPVFKKVKENRPNAQKTDDVATPKKTRTTGLKKKVKCPTCTKTFQSPGYLKRHITAQTCLKRNKRKSTDHRRTSSSTSSSSDNDDDDADAPLAPRVSRPRRSGTAPTWTITLAKHPFPCPHASCGQSFLREEHLAEHVAVCDIRICQFCDEPFPRAQLERHIREHIVLCGLCNMGFHDQAGLDLHMSVMHPNFGTGNHVEMEFADAMLRFL